MIYLLGAWISQNARRMALKPLILVRLQNANRVRSSAEWLQFAGG